MTNTTEFKRTLEQVCKIASWGPSTVQLKIIAEKLVRTKPQKLSDVEAIITGICPNTQFFALEGIDNSDLRTLLLLAIEMISKKG